MPKPNEPSEPKPAKEPTPKSKKTKYEPPKLEKFGALQKLIVSGE